MKHWSLRVVAASVLLLFCTGADTAKPKRMSGHGGFPLDDAVTSMWAAVDEPVSAERPKPLTFMIYFVGTPGWHKAKWTLSSELRKSPAFVEFAGPVVLRAELDQASGRLSVFGQAFPIADSNVFVVRSVDDADRRRVIPLGRFDLDIPADANPAEYVLRKFEEVRNGVFPGNN